MGLFEKKFCDICGNKIGLLGNKKLADGNMCKDCQNKLSRWFTERRESSIAQIKEQLAYREENAAAVASFRPTKEIGTRGDKFFLIDEKSGKFVVLREGEAMDKNPDLLDVSLVRNVRCEVKEDRTEVRHKNAEGNMVSFVPKHYSYRYKFTATIEYDGRFFDEIKFSLNTGSINGGTDDESYNGGFDGISGKLSAVIHTGSWGQRSGLPGGYRTDGLTTMRSSDIQLYQEYERIGNEIIDCLTKKSASAPEMQPAAPQHGTPEDKSEQIKNLASQPTSFIGMGAMGMGAPNAGNAANAAAAAATQTQTASWTCEYCGTANSGNFCTGCGAKKD